jgi:ATP-dependent Clp protease ATP-binding subunit ClpA
LIQKEIENTIARRILAGEVKGDQAVVVDYQGERLVFVAQAEAGVKT